MSTTRTRDKLKINTGWTNYYDFREKNMICFANQSDKKALYEIPHAELVEYDVDQSIVVNNINYIIHHIKFAKEDPVWTYKGLYMGTKTGNRYIVPYLEQFHHSVTSNWDDPGGTGIPGLSQAENLLTKISKIMKPAAGILYAKQFTGTTEAAYSLRFNLINTANDENAIQNNFSFITKLLHQNLHNQTSYSAVQPPCLYEVYIPGVRYCPVASLSITVTNVGTLNKWKTTVIPDAWSVIINIRELLSESQQIYEDCVKGLRDASDVNIHVFEKKE